MLGSWELVGVWPCNDLPIQEAEKRGDKVDEKLGTYSSTCLCTVAPRCPGWPKSKESVRDSELSGTTS